MATEQAVYDHEVKKIPRGTQGAKRKLASYVTITVNAVVKSRGNTTEKGLLTGISDYQFLGVVSHQPDVDALTDQGKNALALAIDKGYMDIARLLFHRTSGTEDQRSAHFWHPENQQKDCNWTAGMTGWREREGWVASFPCTDRGQRYAARFFDPMRNTGCAKEASNLRDAYRERCREESREYDRKRIADWNI